MVKVLTFSHDYSKLNPNNKTFSTIRLGNKFNVKDVVWVRGIQGWLGKAHLLLKHQKTLNELSTDFLLQDTDCKTRNEAIKLIKSFYSTKIDIHKEKFTIYYFIWEKFFNPNNVVYWDFTLGGQKNGTSSF